MREEKRKVPFRMGEHKTEVVWLRNEHEIHAKCKDNPWGISTCISGSRYRIKKIMNVVKKTCTDRRKIILLKDGEMILRKINQIS